MTKFEALMGGLAATLTVLAILTVFVRRIVKRTSNFLDDWNGEDGRPGVARRPGIMERISVIDNRLSRVEGQVTPNGGSSMADKVNHIVDQMKEGNNNV